MTKYVKKRLEEVAVIELLTSRDSALKNLTDFLYGVPFKRDFHDKYLGAYVAINLPRTCYGFSQFDKPGDYDIILIPFSEDCIYFERTSAIEVKIVRPTMKDHSKGPNSLGTEQTKGLVRDGFPCVGLLHVVMGEPLPSSLVSTMPFYPEALNENIPYDPKNPLGIEGEIEIDSFAFNSVARNQGRLMKAKLPTWIYTKTLGLNFISENDVEVFHLAESYDTTSRCNPYVSQNTIEAIKSHFFGENTRYNPVLLDKPPPPTVTRTRNP